MKKFLFEKQTTKWRILILLKATGSQLVLKSIKKTEKKFPSRKSKLSIKKISNTTKVDLVSNF